MIRIPFARRLSIALICLAAIATPTLSSAQAAAGQPVSPSGPGQGQGPGIPPGAPETMSPGEFNRMFEAYALLQAQNQLKLTDEQYADFIVRLRGLQNVRRQHQQ